MITALTTIFVLVSLGLVVTVPVALATPGEWENSKGTFTRGFQGWIFLVIAIAAADGIGASI
uniref:Z protein of photosystem II n=1 Tax=Haslea provincialis TaxID=1764367 RepID=UPI00218B08C9|nr:Z protein of photosystem II [Haslea provincialis]YP_010517048.1 Z protein of photosystem II [Haslea karadagensis]UQS76227.1 Z protein of photosystem II [Haslea ostrearia]UXN44699.1 Z protein of photosystem II [Haslea provincialis]UXN44830.1 Z protein of photosystem II [Haslea karadagensis]UXN44961.1 Z protein of photosystem II [Haslea karadagensis]UXN45092.1 Z protein of photosystem II [Haslea karadagensis]